MILNEAVFENQLPQLEFRMAGSSLDRKSIRVPLLMSKKKLPVAKERKIVGYGQFQD